MAKRQDLLTLVEKLSEKMFRDFVSVAYADAFQCPAAQKGVHSVFACAKYVSYIFWRQDQGHMFVISV